MGAVMGGCGRESGAGRGSDPADLARGARSAVVRVSGNGEAAQGAGSGFVVRGENGEQFVLSNHHVVWGATGIKLELTTGAKVPATVVGVDPAIDLAVIRPGFKLDVPPLSFGDDSRLRPGDRLLSIGWPHGITSAVSSGILSARGEVPDATLLGERSLDYLFTDAVLGAGASGGPVLDMSGEVVGINTAVMGEGRGLGVLLPARLAAYVSLVLERQGHIEHSCSGMQVVEDAAPSRQGLSLRVASVTTGDASQAGQIRSGDEVLAIDGKPVRDASDFRWREFMASPRTVWNVELGRDGLRKTVSVSLHELPCEAMRSTNR
jgi:serine protease Do